MNTDVLTKRMILSTTAKFFVPLGLISPVILQLKILFQNISRAKINDWDEGVDGELKQRFVDITEDIRHTKTILVNRCYFTTIDDMNDVESVQLHMPVMWLLVLMFMLECKRKRKHMLN